VFGAVFSKSFSVTLLAFGLVACAGTGHDSGAFPRPLISFARVERAATHANGGTLVFRLCPEAACQPATGKTATSGRNHLPD